MRCDPPPFTPFVGQSRELRRGASQLLAGVFVGSTFVIPAALMPTNLPDRRKQEVQANEDFLRDVMIAVLALGMFIALALTSLLP